MSETAKKFQALTAVACLMLAAAVCLVAASSEESEADADYSYYTYAITVQYSYTDGSDLPTSVVYDFGDDTIAIVGEEITDSDTYPDYANITPDDSSIYASIKHVYSATGTYTVTQTVINSVGSNSDSWTVEIKGFPVVTYVIGLDQADVEVTQSNYDVAPEVPEVSADGYTLMGWYTDSDLTTEADLTEGITESTLFYAKWSSDSDPETVTVTIAASDGTPLLTYDVTVGSTLSRADIVSDLASSGKVYAGLYTDSAMTSAFDFGTEITDDVTLYASYTDLEDPDDHGWVAIGLAVAGIVAILSVIVIRHYAPAILGIALIVLAALVHFGVIAW